MQNEQSHIRLSSFWLFISYLPHLAALRQGGVNRLPQAPPSLHLGDIPVCLDWFNTASLWIMHCFKLHRACILVISRFAWIDSALPHYESCIMNYALGIKYIATPHGAAIYYKSKSIAYEKLFMLLWIAEWWWREFLKLRIQRYK